MATAAQVLVGNADPTTGGVLVAPLATALPTTAAASLDAAFDNVGYISEDGVSETNNNETTDITAWQGNDVVRTVQTKHTYTLQFTMIETSAITQEVFYGNYTAGTVEVTGEQPVRQSWIVEVADGDQHIRVVVPAGQVTERGDVVYRANEPIGYQVTITCYPDDDGVKAYKYLDVDGS